MPEVPPPRETAAIVVFALVYVVLGFGALPPLRVDRAGATLIGATLMVALGVLAPHEAAAAIDFHTIGLLLGMMIVVAHLRLAGFFAWVDARALRGVREPRRFLLVVLWLSGALSALFVNDTACLLLTPLVLETTLAMGIAPVPHLLAIAVGANLGSVATIVGNPQNMMVASFSGLSYARFAGALLPVAIAGLAAASLLLPWLCAADLRRPPGRPAAPPAPEIDRPSLRKAVLVSALLLAGLLAGLPPSLAALGAAAALLVTRRVDPAAIYARVDWSLLLLFAGLFVVVAGVERTPLPAWLLGLLPADARDAPLALAGATLVLSNVVSNVPAVLLLKGWAALAADAERAWLVLAMTSTLAGNLTLVGSVANLIVVEQSRGRARIGFWSYARVGVPVTLVTLAIGLGWLLWTRR